MTAPLLDCLEIETAPGPTHAVIWLHGLGADANDFAPIVPEVSQGLKKAVRFVFPNAPVQPVTINGGMAMRSWYDILVMDLVRLGRPECARDLVVTYRWAGGDPGGEDLIAFFAAYRAWVRAAVACERAAELGEDDARAASEAQARELVDLGHRFAWQARGPSLLVVCGLSASGKTTLAERLARLYGERQSCSIQNANDGGAVVSLRFPFSLSS